MNTLTFTFSASNYNGWPSIEILLDGQIVAHHDFDSDQTKISITVNKDPGQHQLIVRRLGKTDRNILFRDGVILEDQIVTLDDILVDDVKLPDTFKWQGTFFYDDQVLPSVVDWGPNGHWVWDFETPVITWVLDIRNRGVRSDDIIIPNPDNLQELKSKVQEFKRIWGQKK